MSRLKWIIIGVQLCLILALAEWVQRLRQQQESLTALSQSMYDRTLEIISKPVRARRVAREIVMLWMEHNGQAEEPS